MACGVGVGVGMAGIREVESREKFVEAGAGFRRQVGEIHAPVRKFPVGGPGLLAEFLSDQTEPFRALLGHVLLDQAGSRPVSPGEEGGGQLSLHSANSEQTVFVARGRLFGSVDFEKDGEEGIGRGSPSLFGELDQPEEIIGNGLDQEFEAGVVGHLAVVAHEMPDLNGIVRVAPGNQLLGELAVLVEYVVGEAKVAAVDGRPQIAVEKLHAEDQGFAVIFVGFGREVAGLDRQKTADIPSLSKAIGEKLEKLAKNFDVKPTPPTPQTLANTRVDGHEGGGLGNCTVQGKEGIGQLFAKLPKITEEVGEGFAYGHGNGSVLVLKGSACEVCEFFDCRQDLKARFFAAFGVGAYGFEGLDLESANRIEG